MNDDGENRKLDRFLRFPELELRFGRCRRSIRRHSETGKLPPLVRDGRIVGMLESAVEAHFQKLRGQQVSQKN